MKVCVVGAGIVGLSSAVCIQNDLPHAEVTIIAEKTEVDTTSDGAAGFFLPYAIPAENMFHVDQWLRDSYNRYRALCYSDDAADAGVFELSGYSLSETDETSVQDPILLKYMKNFRELTDVELKQFGGGPWRKGLFLTTLITEPRKMMPFLSKQFRKNGGIFVQRRLESLAELIGHYQVVVNCSGLGARNLVDDQTMFPIRGQVLRLNAPWVKHFYFVGYNTYIIPNTNEVVVGGTHQIDNWSTDIDQTDREKFLQKSCELLPSLKTAAVVREWCGLRPGRPTVRLELETIRFDENRSLPVVHNYGHAGNGIALSWGCGVHVGKIVSQIAQDLQSQDS